MPVINEKPSRVISGIKLYDTDKLSKILETDINTIRRFFREEKFPKVRINRRYYLSEQDLLKFLTTGKTEYRPDLKEAQAIERMIIKKTEQNLETIARTLERLKRYPGIKFATDKLEERYDNIKKELEENKKNLITEEDL